MTDPASALLLPPPAVLAAFAGTVFLLNATPGVDFVFTVSRTLQHGVRAGCAAALGIGAGCVVHALAAAFGLASLMAVHPQAFTAVQWAGAAYLAWLGIGLLRQSLHAPAPDPPHAAPADRPAPNAGADFRAGVLTNLLNPKMALFFFAFVPQFVPTGSPDKTASFLLLAAWSIAQGTVFLGGLVWLSARLRTRLQVSSRVQRLLKAAGGLLFLGLALRVAAGRQPVT